MLKHFFNILKLIFVLTSVYIFQIEPNAATLVDKAKLPYEILTIQIHDQTIYIKGWAFISYVQHFINEADHAIEVQFTSLNHQFTVNTSLYSHTKTDLMEYFGSPLCSETSVFQSPETCNYRYERVGFEAYIPLSYFQENQAYQAHLVVHAYRAQVSYQTPIYYPMADDLILSSTTHDYRFISRLDDTSLKVNATTVIARKSPGKTGEIWYYGSNCSTTYLNQLFFYKDTFYYSIYEKVWVDDTSYYRMSGKISLCVNSRRRIVEGTTIVPVWIASPYVLYSGSPLTIHKIARNQAPYFNKDYIKVVQGEPFDLKTYITAQDLEDGDLTYKIVYTENTYIDEVGEYYAKMHVTDSGNLTTHHTVRIVVVEPPNEIPIIYAEDKTIMQHTYFNPFLGVSAYDKEDGDITDYLIVLNEINAQEALAQILCYYVEDSKKANTTKCINVNVVSYTELINKFRFVSKNYLFFGESTPMNWNQSLFVLDNILHNKEPIYTIQ